MNILCCHYIAFVRSGVMLPPLITHEILLDFHPKFLQSYKMNRTLAYEATVTCVDLPYAYVRSQQKHLTLPVHASTAGKTLTCRSSSPGKWIDILQILNTPQPFFQLTKPVWIQSGSTSHSGKLLYCRLQTGHVMLTPLMGQLQLLFKLSHLMLGIRELEHLYKESKLTENTYLLKHFPWPHFHIHA